jgi:disulfide bond formation protein DsbB
MFKIINKNLLNLIAAACALALALAYIAQYVFNYQPCILCLYQRIPFFAIIAISIFVFAVKNKKLQQAALYLALILLLTNAAIAFYQVGVEQKIFLGPDKCSAANLEGISDMEELKQAIIATKAVRCDEPELFFLSLSTAAWNVIYCLALFIAAAFFIKKSRR